MSNLSERGQHTSHEGVGGDNGQRHLVRDPELGKKSVPASPRDGDINTATKEAE